ncbi:putative mannose-6-phosphate isomerase GmuF [Aureliella helgolandensis]|uniref:Putative mannose-6-phosphate isomerase GmuF n=2 Tax=Aureliella helgolandensis TaxID=2527968 RepID=A0A518GF21_9BACT|nr:putative mannose-6-phosphate isomerase GmuF [Aureliella helgolandensis]
MPAPYPIKTIPHFQDYLWGGRRLASDLGKPLPVEGVWAESWEIIDHPHHSSIVANGPLAGQSLHTILSQAPEWLLGTAAQQFTSLPLLLKYLDCQRDLSVQVHPDDAYAQAMTPPDLGKTEAWYIVAAEPNSVLYAGLKSDVTPEAVRTAVSNGTLVDCLHEIHPQAGDCVFIPAGTVHALGAGLLVAEIQQASNTTFRLYDWDRVGADGQPRPLHLDQALEVTDFTSGPRLLQSPQSTAQVGRQRLVECDKFVLDRLAMTPEIEVLLAGQFHLLTSPTGGATLYWTDDQHTHSERLARGESVLLPAALEKVTLELSPEACVLDMSLPPG